MSKDERLEVLRAAAPDSWIALSEDESKVVGRGPTYKEAVDEAERNGCAEPLILKVPEKWIPHVF